MNTPKLILIFMLALLISTLPACGGVDYVTENAGAWFKWFGIVVAIATSALLVLAPLTKTNWDNRALKWLQWITANVLSRASLIKAPPRP